MAANTNANAPYEWVPEERQWWVGQHPRWAELQNTSRSATVKAAHNISETDEFLKEWPNARDSRAVYLVVRRPLCS